MIQTDEKKRLEQFEEMLSAVQTEYDSIVRQLETLKERGKMKSVTYQQLFTRKLPKLPKRKSIT